MLTFKIIIQASQQAVFDYVSDWEAQSNWILFTTVRKLNNPAEVEDTRLLAVTRFGLIRLSDTMVVTDWQPPEKIIVEHTGRVILGKGVFTVQEISTDSCEFSWQEITPVPFGFIGQFGLFLARPLLNIMFGRSLGKLKAAVERGDVVVKS